MERARTVVLLLFGLLALFAYAPLLAVSYDYFFTGQRLESYGTALGAIACLMLCVWLTVSAWKEMKDDDGHQN